MQTFKDLGLSDEILRSLDEIGFEKPTEIQQRAIPNLINDKPHFIGLAQTGTGKTAAFGLPLLQWLDTDTNYISKLILAPTRELAQQIAKELESFGKYIPKLRIDVVYGGTQISTQIRSLKSKPPHILVATPGRLQDLVDRKAVSLSNIDILVLDEADEMLNMGFQEAIDNILTFTPEDKVLWLFSATMPPEIRRIIGNYMHNPIEVRIVSETKTNSNIDHKYIYVQRHDKKPALKRVLDYLTDFYGVIFCKTKIDTQELAEYLELEGYRAEPLHGDLTQSQRDAVMAKFRNKSTSILVATDVAARGIDVDDLTHVVHYSLPDNPEYYTHRSGRTARAGKKGTSLAIVTPQDVSRIRFFEKSISAPINHVKVPLQSQMYEKRLEKFTEKVNFTDTIELTEEIIDKALSAFSDLSKRDLVAKIVALEFNKLYKKVEKDDLNIDLLSRRNDRSSSRERTSGRYGDREHDRDRERRSSSRESRGSGGIRESRSSGERVPRQREGMDTFFVNLGKIDNIHPGALVDILADYSGMQKKQIGNISIQKKHSLVEIDRKFSKFLNSGPHLKYKGRKITIKKEK